MDKELRLSNTTLVVTFRCNLKCKLCAVHAPYYEQPPHYSLELLQSSIDRFFEAVDYVDKFTVNGGEPLIHPQIAQIMEYLLKYIERIGMLEIITNGSIIPSQQLVEVLGKSEKIDILLDDYGPELSKGVEKTVQIFDEQGIKYRRRKYFGEDAHLGGWVDLRDLTKKNRTPEETEAIYKKCAYPGPFHCFVLMGGRAYICGVYRKCINDGIIPDIKEEYVNFLAEEWDVAQVRNAIRTFYDRPYFSACEYCNGFCMDSERYMPAEQIGAN